MPKGRGRGGRRQGARRLERKAPAGPIEQPTVQKTAGTTSTPQKTTSTAATPQTARRQSPTQLVDTTLSHVKGDLIRVGAVTVICILLLVVPWAVLR